ncbi:MAG: hypothetical protein SFZ24_09725 [Planctomycetota bacterium]|nr:hypothetical protein [Planctomycetota bacterium]
MQCFEMKKTIGVGVLALTSVAGSAIAGGPFPPGPGPWGPDITICQLYGLAVFGRTGSYPNGQLGLAAATTSWNIGTVNSRWFDQPNPEHPFIALNMYRKSTWQVGGVPVDRLEQIGMNWPKHAFFALSNTQCGPHPYLGGNCRSTNGTFLGVGCTDTYGAGLNANQGELGPRFEINPWTSGWSPTGSRFYNAATSNVNKRLQVREQDLIAPPGVTYNLYYEAYYNAIDDVDAINSHGWKPISSYAPTNTANPANTGWTFTSTGSTSDENSGMALDAWTGARQTLVAQQFPIVEQWSAANAPRPGEPAPGPASPDGRAVIVSKVFNLGNGQYQYEYAVYNIDMDRQIGEFKIPVPEGVTVTNIGFSGVRHYDEPFAWSTVSGGVRTNGKAIDNSPWTGVRNSTDVTWATAPVGDAAPSNPIRWSMMFNFWFTADRPPVDGLATLGLFRTGTPGTVSGLTDTPSAPPPPPHCMGDADGDFDRDFADISEILGRFGATYVPGSAGRGDADNDGDVDFGDVTATLGAWQVPC